ncbi:hypothetical protein AGLY_012578 [Aphis glycines]|uniref:Eukaryotic translation initiation factor 3 subunit K n=3 Tax=Aphis TaxID=464929 RepID=A0A9P0IZ98_APHGO|nr:eukaryotic translation initiation factor 3 subunit K [Aphis gossypii]KAE9528156.1 hypothetical protein AGLY_012578 [Aphis glycines]KAF0769287.1 eukaryotic translation initiation factor 3 subunit K [Aphis craccivora]CAH1724427.1 unnamed protein product [Aphis gossypii]
MAEAMRQTVASLLQGIERYNPQHLSTLEHYVEVQSQENTYDLEANLAVLKIYQFHHDYNLDITVQIMLKAITNFPHSDFVLCKCLLNEKLCQEAPLSQVLFLADLLENCNFKEFWYNVHSTPELYAKVNGFLDSVRKFVCHVIGITFQSIEKHFLMELLGGIDDAALKHWILKYNWKELDNKYVFVANQDENIKTKNITEKIDYENILGVMASCR